MDEYKHRTIGRAADVDWSPSAPYACRCLRAPGFVSQLLLTNLMPLRYELAGWHNPREWAVISERGPRAESTEKGKVFALVLFGAAFAALGLGLWFVSQSRALALAFGAMGILGMIMSVAGLVHWTRFKAVIREAEERARSLPRK
jgi:hypothetical protein